MAESRSLKDKAVPRFARLFGGQAPQKSSNPPMGLVADARHGDS
jgi:hypothetical protein